MKKKSFVWDRLGERLNSKELEIYEPYRLYDDETLLDAIRLGKTYINPNRYIADYVEERPKKELYDEIINQCYNKIKRGKLH